MDNIINSLDAFFGDYFGINFPNVQITDIVEIIIIAFFIYQLLIWVQNTRTWMLFRGLLVVVAFFILAALFQMSTILWLGEKLLNVALIMVIVVFQPELRKALEDLGCLLFLPIWVLARVFPSVLRIRPSMTRSWHALRWEPSRREP